MKKAFFIIAILCSTVFSSVLLTSCAENLVTTESDIEIPAPPDGEDGESGGSGVELPPHED